MGQTQKGQLAGGILLRALAAPDMAALNITDEEQHAWAEMHSVAHLWAAKIEFGGMPDGDRFSAFLLRSEHLLDQMQNRSDLCHPDPWRCSKEMRAHLETI